MQAGQHARDEHHARCENEEASHAYLGEAELDRNCCAGAGHVCKGERGVRREGVLLLDLLCVLVWYAHARERGVAVHTVGEPILDCGKVGRDAGRRRRQGLEFDLVLLEPEHRLQKLQS